MRALQAVPWSSADLSPSHARSLSAVHPDLNHRHPGRYGVGRGRGVPRGRGVGVCLGVAVGVTLGVTVGVAVGVTVGVTVAVGVGVGVTVTVGVGVTVTVGVGVTVGVTLGVGVGEGQTSVSSRSSTPLTVPVSPAALSLTFRIQVPDRKSTR